MYIVMREIKYRGIAQLVEQWSPKPRAEGSSPSAPAILNRESKGLLSLFFCYKCKYDVVYKSYKSLMGEQGCL